MPEDHHTGLRLVDSVFQGSIEVVSIYDMVQEEYQASEDDDLCFAKTEPDIRVANNGCGWSNIF